MKCVSLLYLTTWSRVAAVMLQPMSGQGQTIPSDVMLHVLHTFAEYIYMLESFITVATD
jgi:hypothetical protein